MGVRDAFSDEEWKQVKDLPSDAAMLVMIAGKTGPIQMTKESAATAKALVDARDSADPLVAAVVADLLDHDKSDKPTKPEGVTTREQMHDALLASLRSGWELIGQKAPESASGYAQFVVALCHKVAEAAKEGFGGPRVSDEETAAIAEVEATLKPAATS